MYSEIFFEKISLYITSLGFVEPRDSSSRTILFGYPVAPNKRENMIERFFKICFWLVYWLGTLHNKTYETLFAD